MVQGPKTVKEAVRLLRKAVRAVDRTWSVVGPITDPRGRSRGNGSHTMWAVFDSNGKELARGSVTGHSRDMSWTVTRSFEADFEGLLGKGWMDR